MGAVASRDLMTLLLNKHHKDLAVPEAPLDSAYTGAYGQIDCWVMRKSWARPDVFGYEIKVSRQDFTRDTKWRKYLPHCTQFFFVAPKGMIDPAELPPEAGLLEATTNVKRLITKKQAPVREIDIEAFSRTMKSILINRARVVGASASGQSGASRGERMSRYRQMAQDRRTLAQFISERIRDGWADLRQEVADAEQKVQRLERLRESLLALGIDPDKDAWRQRSEINALIDAIPLGLPGRLQRASNEIDAVRREVEKIMEGRALRVAEGEE